MTSRAREERPRIVNLTPAQPVFSDFEVLSPSGLSYRAEIRDVANRQAACTCTDFRINGLGTCKQAKIRGQVEKLDLNASQVESPA